MGHHTGAPPRRSGRWPARDPGALGRDGLADPLESPRARRRGVERRGPATGVAELQDELVPTVGVSVEHAEEVETEEPPGVGLGKQARQGEARLTLARAAAPRAHLVG